MNDEENTCVQAEQLDDIDITKKVLVEHDNEDEPSLDEQIRVNNLKNVTLAEADLHMIGDRTVLAQVVQLLSYIRHSVKNNMKSEISLKICNSNDTVANAEFNFDVNGCQVPDCITQSEWWIN